MSMSKTKNILFNVIKFVAFMVIVVALALPFHFIEKFNIKEEYYYFYILVIMVIVSVIYNVFIFDFKRMFIREKILFFLFPFALIIVGYILCVNNVITVLKIITYIIAILVVSFTRGITRKYINRTKSTLWNDTDL